MDLVQPVKLLVWNIFIKVQGQGRIGINGPKTPSSALQMHGHIRPNFAPFRDRGEDVDPGILRPSPMIFPKFLHSGLGNRDLQFANWTVENFLPYGRAFAALRLSI